VSELIGHLSEFSWCYTVQPIVSANMKKTKFLELPYWMTTNTIWRKTQDPHLLFLNHLFRNRQASLQLSIIFPQYLVWKWWLFLFGRPSRTQPVVLVSVYYDLTTVIIYWRFLALQSSFVPGLSRHDVLSFSISHCDVTRSCCCEDTWCDLSITNKEVYAFSTRRNPACRIIMCT